MNILRQIKGASDNGKKLFAVLLDPDKCTEHNLPEFLDNCGKSGVDLLLAGSSLMIHKQLDDFIRNVKEISSIPLVLFPANPQQISFYADGILFLSLISGRNPELLIGRHVEAAPLLKDSSLEILPTGYMLIGSGNDTTARYMSNTMPIPGDKDDIAMCTALAGKMLGLQLIYLDAGSGAANTVSESMIRRVRENVSLPLLVGGGIKNAETAQRLAKAGADVIVVGNSLESSPELLPSMAKAIHSI